MRFSPRGPRSAAGGCRDPSSRMESSDSKLPVDPIALSPERVMGTQEEQQAGAHTASSRLGRAGRAAHGCRPLADNPVEYLVRGHGRIVKGKSHPGTHGSGRLVGFSHTIRPVRPARPPVRRQRGRSSGSSPSHRCRAPSPHYSQARASASSESAPSVRGRLLRTPISVETRESPARSGPGARLSRGSQSWRSPRQASSQDPTTGLRQNASCFII